MEELCTQDGSTRRHDQKKPVEPGVTAATVGPLEKQLDPLENS